MVKPEPYSSGRFTYTWTNALAPRIFTVGALGRVRNPTSSWEDCIEISFLLIVYPPQIGLVISVLDMQTSGSFYLMKSQ